MQTDYEVPYGSMPLYNGPIPTKADSISASYSFKGWDEEIKPVTGNQTYKATFGEQVKVYTVTWVDEDDHILYINNYAEHGQVPIYPYNLPEKPSTESGYSYSFTGWSPEVSEATCNVTYKATYTYAYVPETVF